MLQALHVAAAVLWLGNFVVTGVWSARAVAAHRVELEAFAAREILFTDALFTLLLGAAVTVSGIALARSEGTGVWQTAWTRGALEIVLGAGFVWIAALLPLEVAMYRRTSRGIAMGGLFRAWSILGWAVTACLFSIIYLMFAKPV